MSANDVVVRAPGSTANLGAGFDVFGMALDLYADVGTGSAPDGAQQIDEHHPARAAFSRLGGDGDIWLRCNIPMSRGLGFSGAVRVAAAGLAVVQTNRSINDEALEILDVTTELEGHGDNVSASLFGGVTAFVDDRSIPFLLGPVLGNAAFIAWIPDQTTSTDSSRRSLSGVVSRSAAVHNIGRATQLVLAFAHDDPELLVGSTRDQLHQAVRLPEIEGAEAAIEAGVDAGAWCGWLSGSGPTIGFFADPSVADDVAAALPSGAHTKMLSIDRTGARLLRPGFG